MVEKELKVLPGCLWPCAAGLYEGRGHRWVNLKLSSTWDFSFPLAFLALINLSSWSLKKAQQDLLHWFQSFSAPLVPA